MLISPEHPLASRSEITMEEFGRQTVIAHNEASPARERVLRLYEQRHTSINIQIGLPSLDGIKRAVEMGLGVALLPQRCARTEIARGQLAAVKVPELRLPRQIRLAYRRSGEMSHAAAAFLDAAHARKRQRRGPHVPSRFSPLRHAPAGRPAHFPNRRPSECLVHPIKSIIAMFHLYWHYRPCPGGSALARERRGAEGVRGDRKMASNENGPTVRKRPAAGSKTGRVWDTADAITREKRRAATCP